MAVPSVRHSATSLAVASFMVLAGVPAITAAEAQPAGESEGAATLTPEAQAAQLAAQTGQSVEIESLTTETSLTVANPDRSFTTKMSGVPVRAMTGAGWADIDTTLEVRGDGSIGPRLAALDYSFSAGGENPMLAMTEGAASLSWSWPGALPAPQLDGDTARYRDVLPGVDLEMRAGPDGFSHVLVVEDEAAAANPALAELTFEANVQDGTITTTTDGGLALQTGDGEVVLESPVPVMWDSAGTAAQSHSGADDDSHAPSEGDAVAAVDTTLVEGQDQVVLAQRFHVGRV